MGSKDKDQDAVNVFAVAGRYGPPTGHTALKIKKRRCSRHDLRSLMQLTGRYRPPAGDTALAKVVTAGVLKYLASAVGAASSDEAKMTGITPVAFTCVHEPTCGSAPSRR